MNKALFLIDKNNDKPYMDAFDALQKLFADHLELSVFKNPENLRKEDLKDCRLIISHDYADMLNVSEEFSSVLISFVAGGGGWLAMHMGTLVSNKTGLTTLLGTKMVSELAGAKRDFIITSHDHPAMEETEQFTMEASAYQYHFSTIRPGPKQAKRALIYEYLHNNTVCTGGWAQEFGLGRVAGSSLGVEARYLESGMYSKIIKQCGLWAAGLESK